MTDYDVNKIIKLHNARMDEFDGKFYNSFHVETQDVSDSYNRLQFINTKYPNYINIQTDVTDRAVLTKIRPLYGQDLHCLLFHQQYCETSSD